MPENLVTIATFRYLTEAEAAKIHLEAEGITVFLADAEIVNMDWLFANAVGDIKLQVPPAEAEVALFHLNKTQSKRRERAARDDFGEETCLACGADIPEEATTCPACGWSYDNEEE